MCTLSVVLVVLVSSSENRVSYFSLHKLISVFAKMIILILIAFSLAILI